LVDQVLLRGRERQWVVIEDDVDLDSFRLPVESDIEHLHVQGVNGMGNRTAWDKRWGHQEEALILQTRAGEVEGARWEK